MKCFYCKGTLTSGVTTYTSELESSVILVKNVPCHKCTQCGETFFDGTTVKELEKLTDMLGTPVTEVAVLNYNNIVA